MPPDLSPLWISLKTAGIATIATCLLGTAAAYWMLGYQGKWKSFIEGILIAPLVLPPTVVGFLLLLLLGRNGAIGKLLPPEAAIVFTWYAAVLTAMIVAFPLMYKTALGAFEQINQDLLQVARTLGATEWRVFWQVTLPLAIPGLLAGVVLAFARALGEFGATLMLAGNIPGQTQTIPMAIFFAVEAGAMDEARFWAIAILCISLFGIVAVNLWQQHRARQQGRGNQHNHFRETAPQPNAADRSFASNSQNPMVSPTGLTVEICKRLPGFLLEVSFSADDRVLGLLGASGAGKSMILRCIAGVETPTAGRIVLNGRVLFDSKQNINLPSRDRHIALLVQNYALFPHLTVAQNIAFGLTKGRSITATPQKVEAHLAAVHLEGMANRYPHQLSGGQQQRVALARSFASQPQALLLDEPFSALDTHLRSRLEQNLIVRLSRYQGVTLFVTHNLEEAYRVCEDLLVLEDGRSIAYGCKQALFEHPHTTSVAQLTGCKNLSRAVAQGDQAIEAIDWGIKLQAESISSLSYVGIRAHQLTFTQETSQPNTFPCWLATTSETPHRMTLYLKLNAAPTDPQDYDLQAEVFKEKWVALKDQPFPWQVRLDPLRLILMSS
jgi:molybdate ABC transporter permease protein